jgi:hypothetical protein
MSPLAESTLPSARDSGRRDFADALLDSARLPTPLMARRGRRFSAAAFGFEPWGVRQLARAS